MKKILFFTDTALVGGAELQIYLLGKFVSREKYELSIACLDNHALNEWYRQLTEEIKVHRLKYSYKNDPRIFFALYRLLKQKKIDLLHIHLWNPASGRFAFLAARACGVPYLVTEHDPFRLNPLKRGLKKILANRPKAIIAISKENEAFLRQEYRGKLIAHVANGIDTEGWKSNMEKLTVADRANTRREIFGAREHNFVILNVAALHERKGQDILLKAFKLLKEKMEYGSCRLILVGEGEHRQKFQTLTKELELMDSVKFLGQRSDIARLLKASDLFVLPSRREGFGLVLLEAAMAKLPIIATNVGGVPDIIENEKEGVLVPPQNPEMLAQAMMELTGEPEKRLALSSSLHEKVMNFFDAKLMAKRTEAVYDRILAR